MRRGCWLRWGELRWGEVLWGEAVRESGEGGGRMGREGVFSLLALPCCLGFGVLIVQLVALGVPESSPRCFCYSAIVHACSSFVLLRHCLFRRCRVLIELLSVLREDVVTVRKDAGRMFGLWGER